VLGGDTGSRIWMRLREKEGLSYGAGAWTFGGVLDDAGGFGGYAIVAPQNLAKAKASLLEEINRIVTAKVADDELARAKDGWIKQQDTSLSNDTYVTTMLALQTFRGRTTAESQQLRDKVRAVTTADVERVARRYLQPGKLVIVDAGDQAKAKAAATH
jgi:zinc protease